MEGQGPSPSAVFIDTSLDTHLAMLVSDTDTVSDLKEKIKVEHRACFPTFGEIHVNAVKVKRKGDFYHLADSMHVKSAFHGVRKNWFLSIDASILSDYCDGQNMLNPGSSSQPVLLAITSKHSGQLDTAPDDEPETVPNGLSMTSQKLPKAGSYQNGGKVVPVLASANLGVEEKDVVNCSDKNRMSPLPTLGMSQNNETSTSNALSTEPLDLCDSFTTGSRNKKRKKNNKTSEVCNPEDSSHPSSRKAISNEMEMQKESSLSDHDNLTVEPIIIVASDQSIQNPQSSEPHQASFTEKLVEPVQEKGIEMHDVDPGKQFSGDSAGDGVHSCPLVVSEPDNSKREFGQTEVTGGIEKAIITGESAAASKTEDLIASPNKRKKSKRLKETDGEKCINSFTKHVESSLIGRSLADLDKVSQGDESQNKLENRENLLIQARGGGTMLTAAAEPLDMQRTKVESSQQVIEKNLDVESTEEKTKKKSKKSRRSAVENLLSLEMKDQNSDGTDPLVTSTTVNETTNKHTSHRKPVRVSSKASEGNSRGDPPQLTMNVDLISYDHLDKGENLSEARGGETIAKIAAPGQLDVHSSKAESSQQIIEKEVKTDSIGEKTKKKRKKSRKSIGENLSPVEMKDPNSNALELTPMSTTLNDTTNGHNSKPVKAPSHTSEGNNEGGHPQSIINVDPPSRDHLDKGNSNLSQARGQETVVRAANVEPLDVHGTKAESSQQIVEKELNFDCTEEKRRKKKRKSRRSTGENVPCVEVKDPNSDAFEPTTTSPTTLNDNMNEHTRYRKPMEAPCTSEGNDEGGPPRSIFEADLPSGDHRDEGENNLSQAREGETIVRAATMEPLGVHGSKVESSQQIIEKVNFENAEEKKTKKKRKKSGTSTMENLPGVEMKDPKSNPKDPLTLCAMTMDGTANGHTNYLKPMEVPSQISEGNKEPDPAQSIVNVDLPSCDHLAKGENSLSQTNGEETMVRGAPAEPLDVHGTRAESSEQIIDKEIIKSTEENAEKKRKKSRGSTVENLPRVDMENSDSDANDALPISATVNETDKGHISYMKTMKAPSYTCEGNNEGYPSQSIRDGDLLSSGNHLDGVNNHVKPVNGSDIINFSDHFVPRQLRQEALVLENAVVDGGTTENRAAKKVKSKRRKKADSTVDGSSSRWQSSLMSNEPQDGLKSPTGDSYAIQLQESLANNKDKPSGSSGKEPPVCPLSSKSDKFRIMAEEAPGAKVIVVTPNLEKESETSAASGSDMKRTKNVKAGNKKRSGVDRYRLAVRKPSHQDTGEVVDTSERKKSLLATSVTIFKDESSGSSAEAEGIEDSDASTRTPSDMLLSDYSDVDNDANLNSPRDGNLSSKHGGGSSIKKSHRFSDRKDLTLDKILRSSSGYKKAKLAASQSQLEDSEIQPLEFVPDSQANS